MDGPDTVKGNVFYQVTSTKKVIWVELLENETIKNVCPLLLVEFQSPLFDASIHKGLLLWCPHLPLCNHRSINGFHPQLWLWAKKQRWRKSVNASCTLCMVMPYSQSEKEESALSANQRKYPHLPRGSNTFPELYLFESCLIQDSSRRNWVSDLMHTTSKTSL